MKSTRNRMTQKILILYTTILLVTFSDAQNDTSVDQGISKYIVDYCSDYSHYDEGDEFQINLDRLTSQFISNSDSRKFDNFTAEGNLTDPVYGLFLCNSLFSNQACHDCVATAVSEVQQRCPFRKEYMVWYGGCMLRYSEQPILSILDNSVYYTFIYPPAAYSQFNQSFLKTFTDLFSHVTTKNSSALPSGVEVVEVAKNVSLYCYADCTPDLSESYCDSCLKTALRRVLMFGERVGFLLQPNCRLMYIFNDTRPSTSGNTSKKASCKEQNVGLGIISTIAAASLILYGCVYFKRRKRNSNGLDNIETRENLNFDINAIKAATDNFSPSNELGRGGFGVVYKGTLSDGQVVAVKRLSNTSRQGIREFKTEACLAAKLQHKNLVKVHGFCQDQDEKLLIYEYVPNKSLDRFLFDVKPQDCLSWKTRYKVIVGVARGLSYLHEDSNPKIIHRDLKPNNILLDELMNPKIADFGLAKMFDGDQSQGNTNLVAGTFGYMAPEYVTTGRFSNKSDIFSYGVILLEIISGKRNNFSEISSPYENLLSHAWRLWNEGAQLTLVDTAIETNFATNEAERCIQVGLMCIQEDPVKRPSIDSLLLMLHTEQITLLTPSSPPMFPYKREKEEVQHENSQCLTNDTFSELTPR